MDGFAGIVVLLIIFGLVQKFSRKAQANRNTPEAPQPRRAPSKPAKAVPGHASQSVEEMVAAFSEAFLKDNPPRTAVAAQPLPQGASFADGHGCVGGSMEAHTAEGEDPREHAAHLRRAEGEKAPSARPHLSAAAKARELEARRAARPAADAPDVRSAPSSASALRSAGVADLRRAVIMSEVLDKPKALRRPYR